MSIIRLAMRDRLRYINLRNVTTFSLSDVGLVTVYVRQYVICLFRLSPVQQPPSIRLLHVKLTTAIDHGGLIIAGRIR
jgi:hypothetical protein